MGRNLEKDAIEMAAKNQRIMENGFRVFAENTIEKVTMADVAKAANIGVASLYRYYSTKPKLVMAISTWIWGEYYKAYSQKQPPKSRPVRTAAQDYGLFLEAFLDLYRERRDILRFNQFFNVYLKSVDISEEEIRPYREMIRALEARFEKLYQRGQADGTLRADIPVKQMFSASLHLMLAAVTRYAVGLVYNDGIDPEEELRMQKEMLIKRFTI